MPLSPTPYHRQLRDFLRSEEKSLWDWLATSHAKSPDPEARRLELLKSTVRLDAESHPALHRDLSELASKFGLPDRCHAYQAQGGSEPNALLAFLPGEIHVVFQGPALNLLSPLELRAVLAHELAHHRLWSEEGGDFRTADLLLNAATAHQGSANSHHQSARCWSLFTEIYADRAALVATGDLETCVSSLVKMSTGLSQIGARSYLNQAEEIFAKGSVRSQGLTHPELFIRVRALALWQERGAEAETDIDAMVRSPGSIDELDWLDQARVTSLTRRLLGQLLRPAWFQTPSVLAHARLFFPDFVPANDPDPGLAEDLAALPSGVRSYLAWVLADFAMADRSLEDLPMAAAIDWAEKLDLADAFDKVATKDLKLKARELKRLKKEAAGLLAQEVKP